MKDKESAHNLFRLATCRNLDMTKLKAICFDHACSLHAYAMNREAREFELQCTVTTTQQPPWPLCDWLIVHPNALYCCCHTASQCRGCRWPPASGCRPWALFPSWPAGSLPVTPGPRWLDWLGWLGWPHSPVSRVPTPGSHSRTMTVLIRPMSPL